MSSLAEAAGPGRRRYDKIDAAYEGMGEADRASFRRLIQDPHAFSHAQIAEAMREIGHDVDRKQVQQYREKLAIGRVKL